MQRGMNLEALLNQVIQDSDHKRDYVLNTPNLELVDDNTLVVTHPTNHTRATLEPTEQFHRQVASRLKIPQKHYLDLWDRHPDLITHTANELFKREPQKRMLRVLDGKARAFLSNSYKRLDNDVVLQHVIPEVTKHNCKMLSSNVTDTKMYMKVLFPESEIQIGVTPNGEPDIVHSGFILRNSEVGSGSLNIQGFFYRTFCENGCHFGGIDLFNFKRTHIGSKIETEGYMWSNTTLDAEADLIAKQCSDIITNLNSPEFLQRMADQLNAIKNTNKAIDPMETITELSKDVGLRESEARKALQNYLTDGDYTQWGALNAITSIANEEEVSYDRATEIEAIGAKIIELPVNRWNRYATLQAA